MVDAEVRKVADRLRDRHDDLETRMYAHILCFQQEIRELKAQVKRLRDREWM